MAMLAQCSLLVTVQNVFKCFFATGTMKTGFFIFFFFWKEIAFRLLLWSWVTQCDPKHLSGGFILFVKEACSLPWSWGCVSLCSRRMLLLFLSSHCLELWAGNGAT